MGNLVGSVIIPGRRMSDISVPERKPSLDDVFLGILKEIQIFDKNYDL